MLPNLFAVDPARVVRRMARAAGGAIAGTVLGLAMALGLVVFEARFQNQYLESTDDMAWRASPVVVGLIAGATGGWAAPILTAGGIAGGVGGGVGGGVLGSAVGAATSEARSGPWAGGVIGAGIGVALGLAAGLVGARARRRRRDGGASPPPTAGPAGRSAAVAVATLLVSCGDEAPPLPSVPAAPAEDAASVESVLFFFGDPGKARHLRFPILPKLAAEVEHWSGRLDRDSSVVVVALGDIIYPDGMREPGAAGYTTDSVRVESQIDIVRGPRAREGGARVLFVAGNHDWGLMEHREGTRRLKNLGRFVDRARARDGAHVDLVPEAGTGMPYVVNVAGIRLVLLDTAWWIFDAEPRRKAEMVERLADAIASAGEREVVIAAHHPYASAGPHGGEATVWKTLGLRRLLARSGAMLQSLDSRMYRALHAALDTVFLRVGRPLAFVGGHEHSLQVIRHDSATAPHYSFVSGSASKLTPVGWTPGMLYRRSAPGYMRMLVRESGAVDLYVEAAPDRYQVCPEDRDAEIDRDRCMEEGVASYETVFSMRLETELR